MRQSDREALATAVAHALEASNGALPRATAASLATGYGVTSRTVYRHAKALMSAAAVTDGAQVDGASDGDTASADETPAGAAAGGSRAGWWQDAEQMASVLTAVARHSSQRAAWADLHRRGLVRVGYPAFTRQLRCHLQPAVHAGLTAKRSDKGREAYLAASLYCTDTVAERNQRWQADVEYVPVRVRTPVATQASEVYRITFLDDATRLVMASTFTLHRPRADDVAACLAKAVRGWTDTFGNFYGGLPASILWDNGGEFLNDTLTEVCARLGIVPVPAPPHSGWAKGKIERHHRTMQERVYSTLPGFTQGPRTFTNKRPWRGADEDLLFFDAFVLEALEGVRAYNEDHRHAVLRQTPAQAWLADTTPLRLAEDELLRPLMLANPKIRIVGKDGVSFGAVKFLAPAMKDWRRKRVEVRTLPHVADRIWLFEPQTQDFICEATPAGLLSAAERQAILRGRAEDYRLIKASITAAAHDRAEAALIADLERQENDRPTPDPAENLSVESEPARVMDDGQEDSLDGSLCEPAEQQGSWEELWDDIDPDLAEVFADDPENSNKDEKGELP